MRRLSLVVVVVAVAACDTPSRDAAPDAATDAAIDGAIDDTLVPFTTTGATPAGPFDDIRFARISYLRGFCPDSWSVELLRTNEALAAPTVALHFYLPDPVTAPTGTITGTARGPGTTISQAVTFEVEHVDVPPTQPLRIAGHVRLAEVGWQLDFSIDGEATPITCF